VDRDSCIGHPGQARAAEIVAHELRVPVLSESIVPVGSVGEDGLV
jgi:hypothetical protein